MSIVSKDDYIGKRVTFAELLESFPDSILILSNCSKEYADIIDGVVIDVVPDNAENRSKMTRLRRDGFEVIKTGGNGGYIHGELCEKVFT
jgi:hypothetical protein